ncbi:MAG: hypothetical protein WBA39_12575, partial [Rivularia sp. (in: cyanobacteria)]
SFDLSPNLSPTRREASSLAPLPLQGRGWGLGLYWTQPKTAISGEWNISLRRRCANTATQANCTWVE